MPLWGNKNNLHLLIQLMLPMNEYLPAEELGKTAQYKEQIPVFSSLTEAQKIALTRRAHILGKGVSIYISINSKYCEDQFYFHIYM